jgi:hypothetical protein
VLAAVPQHRLGEHIRGKYIFFNSKLTHKEELKFYSGPLAATFRQTSMTPHIRAVGEPSRTNTQKGKHLMLPPSTRLNVADT